MTTYFKNIIVGLWTVLVGMRVTLKYLISKPVTVQYPDERCDLPERFRGMVKGDPDKCITCMYCVNVCPVSCIALDGVKSDLPKKVVNLEGKEIKKLKDVTKFDIDISRCIQCGFCVEGCPTGAIYLSHDYENSTCSREDLVYHWAKK